MNGFVSFIYYTLYIFLYSLFSQFNSFLFPVDGRAKEDKTCKFPKKKKSFINETRLLIYLFLWWIYLLMELKLFIDLIIIQFVITIMVFCDIIKQQQRRLTRIVHFVVCDDIQVDLQVLFVLIP